MNKPIVLANRHLIFGFDWRRPNKWQDRALNLVFFQRWDRAQRRRLGWRAGIAVWKETNVPGARVLISRHWPHLLCWSWSIWFHYRHRPKYDGPRKLGFNVSRYYRFADIYLWFWRFHWSCQNYGHMETIGPLGAGAPQIIWAMHKHDEEKLDQ